MYLSLDMYSKDMLICGSELFVGQLGVEYEKMLNFIKGQLVNH